MWVPFTRPTYLPTPQSYRRVMTKVSKPLQPLEDIPASSSSRRFDVNRDVYSCFQDNHPLFDFREDSIMKRVSVTMIARAIPALRSSLCVENIILFARRNTAHCKLLRPSRCCQRKITHCIVDRGDFTCAVSSAPDDLDRRK